MKFSAFVLSLAALVSSACAADAAFMTTSPATFASILSPGSYLENFNGFATANPSSPYSLSANGFSYEFSTPAPGSLYISSGIDKFFGNFNANQTLTITFTSNNVSAVAGNFFITNSADAFVASPVTVTLNDGTTTSFTPSDPATGSYVGFYTNSGTFITSLVLSAPGAGLFNSVDNLQVGSSNIGPAAGEPVPVPATALFGVAAMPLIGLIRRKRA